MISQPNTDAKLTETERAAISIESRIESLIAAVYFLITAVLFGAMVFAMVVFPNETRAGVELLDPDVRTKIGWLLYVPAGTILFGLYHHWISHTLRGKVIKRPDFHQ